MIGGAQGFIDIKNEDALAGAPLKTVKLPFLSTVWLTLVHRAAAEIKTPQLKSFTACPVKDFCSVPSLQPGGGDVEELERCAHDPQ